MLQFILYLFLAFVPWAEMELCVPSFAEIQKVFNLTESQTSWILGSNVLSYCIAAIFLGILADRYGKKKILQYGFFVLTIGSLMLSISNSYYMMIFSRIIQGFGMAGPAVVIYPLFVSAISSDSKKQMKLIGYFNAISGIAVGGAPAIGAIITKYFQYKGNFALIFILSVLAFVFSFFIQQKNTIDKTIKFDFREYLPVFKHKSVMNALMFTSICAYWIFVGMMPLVFTNEYHITLDKLGFYLGSVCFAWGITNMISGKIINYFGKKKTLIYSMIIFVISNFLLLIISIFNQLATPFSIIMVIIFIDFGLICPYNISYVYMMDKMPNAQGRINTLSVITRWIVTTIGTQLASVYYTHSFKSTGLVICMMNFLALLFGFNILRLKKTTKNYK